MRKSKSTSLEASVKVIDGEVIVYWYDAHLRHHLDLDRLRSPSREKIDKMREVTDLGRDYSVTKGKFRLHYRKAIHTAGSVDECYFDGEHLIAQEFRSRVCMTRVVI